MMYSVGEFAKKIGKMEEEVIENRKIIERLSKNEREEDNNNKSNK